MDPAQPQCHSSRRVLVTGGAGFVGSHLTDLLLASGAHVTVVDDLSTGRRENLPAANHDLRFIEGDLAGVLEGELAGVRFTHIHHLAAAVGVQRVMERPIESIETNIWQTSALLRFALTAGPDGEPCPTLLASSSEVYGKGARSPFREGDDCVLGPTTVTRWSYACSKAIDEHLALAYADRLGLPVVVARLFNTVGPRQVGDYGMVLPRFVGAALDGDDLVVHGDGRQSRCFADVRDVVRDLDALLQTPEASGRVVNVGADEPITIGRLADVVIETLSSRSQARMVPYDAVYGEGFEDLRERRPDLSTLRTLTGIVRRTPLEVTIRDVAEALRAGPRAASGAHA